MTGGAGLRPRLMPYRVLPDFLAGQMAEALIAYAVARQADFTPSPALYAGRHMVDPNIRNALSLPDLGPFEQPLTSRILDMRSGIEQALGISPYALSRIELDLTASGDGACFVRHVDTALGKDRTIETRMTTMVLYLHRRPRGFSGGALRLFALGGPGFLDIPPDHNSLAVFPAFTPHAVEPVSCASGDFGDFRFAVTVSLLR